MENEIPITLLNWLVAFLPLVLLFVLLVFVGWSGPVSGGVTLVVTIITSMWLFQSPLETVGVGLVKGLWDALFILLVLWGALFMYHIIRKAGGFEAIQKGIQEYTENYLFLALAFGWVFVSFLQGVAGFGAPIAIVAPLLVGIGFKPLYAVILPLIGLNWANVFGSLGTSWLAMEPLIDLESEPLALLFTGLLLWIADLTAGIFIAWLYGKGEALKEAWPMILIISLIQGGGQVIALQFNFILGSFVPSIIAMGAMLLLTRWDRYSDPTDIESDMFADEEEGEDLEEEEDVSNLSLLEAMTPYIVLTIVSVVAVGIPPVADFLNQFDISFSLPEVSTGFNYVVEAEEAYSPLEIFTHPGMFLLISGIFAYFWFKAKGAYENNDQVGKDIWQGLYSDAVDSTLAIPAFLMISQLLEHSGQNFVLAMGIATIAPPVVYAALSTWIGVAGAFMTSSSTSSNVLFAPLHQSAVSLMDTLSLEQVIASQSAGGAIGNAIAPANVVVGTSTVGVDNDEHPQIYRYGSYYVIISGILITAVSIAMHYI